jgi:hypothetical protein
MVEKTLGIRQNNWSARIAGGYFTLDLDLSAPRKKKK